MALDEQISALIGRIYETAEDPERWHQLLEDVRATLGVRCLMQSVSDFERKDMIRSIVIGDPRRPEGGEEYRSNAFELDPSFRWAIDHPRAGFCDTEEIVPREDYLDQPFVQWNLNEWIGSTHWFVGYTAPEDELTFGLSAHPWPDSGPLCADGKALFRMLFGHMKRAIRLAARPIVFADDDEALILLDRLGQVRKASPAARALLEENDGLTVWKDGQLHVADGCASRRLGSAIQSALDALSEGGFGGAVSIPRPSGRSALLLAVTPLVDTSSPLDAFGPAALVRIVDPAASVASSAPVKWSALFDLSPAEARLAETLLSGDQNLRRAADELGIAYETARVHLKRLLEKTGTHSQSQLSRLLTRVE